MRVRWRRLRGPSLERQQRWGGCDPRRRL